MPSSSLTIASIPLRLPSVLIRKKGRFVKLALVGEGANKESLPMLMVCVINSLGLTQERQERCVKQRNRIELIGSPIQSTSRTTARQPGLQIQ